MRQTAGAGWRVSAHTRPSPVATETGESGKPIRATIAALLRGGDDLPVGLGGADEAPARSGGTAGVLAEQPDAAAATTRARAAASLDQVGARAWGTRIPLLRPTCLLGSSLGSVTRRASAGGPAAGRADGGEADGAERARRLSGETLNNWLWQALEHPGDGPLAVETARFRDTYDRIRPRQALDDRTPRQASLGT
jgi:hypothetical protein